MAVISEARFKTCGSSRVARSAWCATQPWRVVWQIMPQDVVVDSVRVPDFLLSVGPIRRIRGHGNQMKSTPRVVGYPWRARRGTSRLMSPMVRFQNVEDWLGLL